MKKMTGLVLTLVLAVQGISAFAWEMLPAPGVLRVNAHLREEPSTASRAKLMVMKGEKVTILTVVDSWYYVQIGSSTKGYIRSDLFAVDEQSQARGAGLAEPADTLPAVTLKIGMKGEAVLRLQEALHVLGFHMLTLNGNFGTDTEDMVKAFQTNYAIKADGIVGEQTRKMLDHALAFYRSANYAPQDSAEGEMKTLHMFSKE